MNKHIAILSVFAVLSTGAHAQGAQPSTQPGAQPSAQPSPESRPRTGITESTDPTRAEAVQRAASGIQERAARDPQAGMPALARAKTPAGLAFLSGGISVGDRATMHAERSDYSLWVATVAKPSGAYLAGAKLRVVDLKSKTAVLEREMDGPWLMVSLPAGQYRVEATFKADGADKSQTLSEQVSIAPSGLRQSLLRFDSKALVSPDMHTPDGNAFSPPTPTR
ncbi:MAG: hypothetical protein JNN03_04545 [Rubrivivax sp.]|nr:hypothetical protein [Rubrivivax sp.]